MSMADGPAGSGWCGAKEREEAVKHAGPRAFEQLSVGRTQLVEGGKRRLPSC